MARMRKMNQLSLSPHPLVAGKQRQANHLESWLGDAVVVASLGIVTLGGTVERSRNFTRAALLNNDM
jgi:hypothetical protein